MTRTLSLTVFFTLIFGFVLAQKPQKKGPLKRFVESQLEKPDGVRIYPLPVASFSEETSLLFGGSVLAYFKADYEDSLQRPSSIITQAVYTLKNQTILNVYADYWAKQNALHLIGDITYLKFPDSFYGIGNNTSLDDKELTIQRKFGAVADVQKEWLPKFYAGPVTSFQRDKFDNPQDGGLLDSEDFLGEEGGNIWYLGASAAYDTRDQSTYATQGVFSKITISRASDNLASDYSITRIKATERVFFPLGNKQRKWQHWVFGANVNYEGVFGDVPFYQLRELGGAFSMRGYFPGRFRDHQLLTTQAEIRYRPFYLLGFTAFVGAGNVFEENEIPLENYKPNYGVGLRIFAEPSSRTTIRIDYGFGEKLPGEKRIQGLTIFVNESF